MAEFKPIETEGELQARINSVIQDRLARQKETITKEFKEKYSDYDELKKQLEQAIKAGAESGEKLEGLEKDLNEAKEKIHTYEIGSVKNRVAHEEGLPFEFAARLKGEDEDQIREDAKALAEVVSKAKGPAPVRSSEPAGTGKDTAMRQLLENIKGE